ncbi:Vacuolar amino acid transporter 6 [Nosema granulosis]|uniref:Vacuolar amino acid transporter 6 n=1 Tax=Nosema granulosis TaxID=83296 RepID=A0A9P6KZX5_9MICR|nr:Vacuolar amino acid transporter 6 [Nosema granulosis]
MTSKLTVTTATITIITSMLGAGINFMPSAFESIGYIYAGFLMVFITLLTFFSLYAVSFAASKQKNTKNMTYSSIGYDKSYILGFSVDMSIVLSQFLVGLAFFNYVIELAVLFSSGLSKDDGDPKYKYYKLLFMSAIGAVFYMLSLKKDLSSLRFTSYAGVGSVMYLLCLMTFFNFFIKDKVCVGELKSKNNDYSSGVSKIILAMCCQVNMVKVYMEMEPKSTKNILIVSMVSALVGGVIYSAVGYFGYKVLGDEVIKQDLIKLFCKESSSINVFLANEYPKIKFLPSIAIVGAMVVLLGSFPLQLNPAAATIVKLFANERNAEKVRITSVTVMCGSMFLINLYPGLSLDVLLNIVGAIFNNALSFFFPCMYYILSCKKTGPITILSGFIIIFSVLAGSYILYNIIKDLVK